MFKETRRVATEMRRHLGATWHHSRKEKKIRGAEDDQDVTEPQLAPNTDDAASTVTYRSDEPEEVDIPMPSAEENQSLVEELRTYLIQQNQKTWRPLCKQKSRRGQFVHVVCESTIFVIFLMKQIQFKLRQITDWNEDGFRC